MRNELLDRLARHLHHEYGLEYDNSHLPVEDFDAPAREALAVVRDFLTERQTLLPPPSDDEPLSLGFAGAVQVVAEAAAPSTNSRREEPE